MDQTSPAAENFLASCRDTQSNNLPAVLLLIALVLFGGALRIYFFSADLSRSPDERTYAYQANVILTQGTAGLRLLGEDLVRNPALRSQAPSPARLGYLALLVSFMRLTGDTSTLAGTQLSNSGIAIPRQLSRVIWTQWVRIDTATIFEQILTT
jgi:hypothetical protein